MRRRATASLKALSGVIVASRLLAVYDMANGDCERPSGGDERSTDHWVTRRWQKGRSTGEGKAANVIGVRPALRWWHNLDSMRLNLAADWTSEVRPSRSKGKDVDLGLVVRRLCGKRE